MVMVVVSAGVSAQEKKMPWVADAARGEKLVDTFCTSCHLVSAKQDKPIVAGVPSFRYVSNLPNNRIAGALIKPHAPMPNMQLTRKEISDILAYIEDVRRKADGEPPATRELPKKKPKYPSAS